MDNEKINLSDIPESLDMKISQKLVNYSVALGRLRNDDARTFRILGSGTLVQKAGKYGILTAHHCLHAVEPEITLGQMNTDKLICVLNRSQTVVIENYELGEIQLAYPKDKKYKEHGPDLTFINILSMPRLSTFKAISSFWSLDTDINEVKNFVSTAHILANSGLPEANYNIEINSEKNYVSPKIKLMSFINDMDDGHIEYVNGWDYIDSGCNYVLAKEAPRSFRGLSGGGIWAVKLKFNEDTKEWDIRDVALIGMTFYESAIKNEMIFLRGHFIDSIYNRAWNNSQ